jgi:bifunctional oligoribonuclease and PAP phosphatase NrnA
MQDTNQAESIQILKNANNILIVPSTPMDGDSIGSALAMQSVLRKLGKTVTVASSEPVPESLKFLPFVGQIETEIAISNDFVISLDTEGAEVDHLKYEVEPNKINIIVTPKQGQFHGHNITFPEPEASYDLILAVDTGDIVQLGKLYEENKAFFEKTPMLNIDHHASNGKFGTYNYVDPSVAAATQILTPLIQEMEKEAPEELIDEDVATLLLVGIITDTGSFQHTNTSPEAFEVAADLLERGARQQEIIKHIFKTKSLATLKLWGRVLSKIKYNPDAKLVYSTITQQDLADTGADSSESGGIIDELMSNAPDAEVVMLLKEKEPGLVSGSLRAPGKLADVSEIAGKMGGGGHKKAAGFRIRDKSIEEALQIAETTIANYLQSAVQPGQAEAQSKQLFPGLESKPETPQTSIPAPSPGGEDMLLEDFRKRQNPDKEIEQKGAAFFQDADGQEKPQEPTVGDVLSQTGQN